MGQKPDGSNIDHALRDPPTVALFASGLGVCGGLDLLAEVVALVVDRLPACDRAEGIVALSVSDHFDAYICEEKPIDVSAKEKLVEKRDQERGWFRRFAMDGYVDPRPDAVQSCHKAEDPSRCLFEGSCERIAGPDDEDVRFVVCVMEWHGGFSQTPVKRKSRRTAAGGTGHSHEHNLAG